ncbi:MAG: phosphate/phosphite/phosphonate ABC transporter substrate-binding protein [Bdellovibrionales bacterium]
MGANTMRMKSWLLLVGTLSFLTVSVGCKKEKGPIGSENNPLKMFFVPSDDTHTIALSAKEVDEYLEKYVSQKLYGKDTGFYIEASVPASYIAVVEAFGTERADFAAINTFSYILLKDKKKYPAEAVLNILRGEGESTYKAQIIARADSKINNLEDLKGKKFAFTDPASTSGYILPAILFNEKGIDLGEKIFAGRHDNVVTMVYQRQVDAGATYHSPEYNGELMDARRKVKTQFPDVFEKIKIISFTEEIPNAPWVLRTNMYGDDKETYEKVKNALVEGLLEFSNTDNGKETMMKLYSITGLIKASDDDFQGVRDMFAKSAFDVEQLLKK